MTQYKTIILKPDDKGFYCCDIPITKQQWSEILHDKSIVSPLWLRVLLSFYFMPGHKATCYQCSEKYGYHYNVYNSGITALGRAVAKKLKTFSVVNEEGAERFWPIAIGAGRYTQSNGSFEYQLRKELAEAIEDFLLEDAVAQYLSDFESHWEEKSWNESYKWRNVKWFRDNWDLDAADFPAMLEKALSKTSNLLQSGRFFARGMIVNMAKAAPEEVRSMFRNLFDENADISERVQSFIDESERIRVKYNDGTWDNHYQSTNPISVYLWLKYPDKYFIYKYGVYKDVQAKLGLQYAIKTGGVNEMLEGYRMYDFIQSKLLKMVEMAECIKAHVNGRPELYDDPQLYTATIDLGYWISKAYVSLEESLFQNKTQTMTPFISEASELLKHKKNIILQGAPGTGKTYTTAALALAVIDGNVPENRDELMARYDRLRGEHRIGFTTFHQAMDYEDFVEGIKPIHDNGTLKYEPVDGIFKRICTAAREQYAPKEPVPLENVEKPFVLIIDEINRGNVSKIFGELITLLEKDKRIGAENSLYLPLPYSKTDNFGVPQNLYIIGTMNTTDRSTGTIDYAIRRRFAFLTLPADREIIQRDDAKVLFDDVRAFIERYKYSDMDLEDLMVGHSYFMADDAAELQMKVKFEIIPLLKEYIKDGILSVKPADAKKYFESWLKLEAFNDNDNGTQPD